MNRWGALALLVALAGALALRVPRLDARPLHNDEGVNAVKLAALWETGRYAYDPHEFHGPSLHYCSLPFLWLSGAKSAADLTDSVLRLAPVAFGVAMLFLLPLLADGLGRQAVVWAAVFTAVSPAMVFYNRYFIHETLLVFFTLLAITAAWRYAQSRKPGWAAAAGAAVGLMFATKETFILALAAVVVGVLATLVWEQWLVVRPETRAVTPARRNVLGRVIKLLQVRWNWRDAALAAVACVIVWLLLFSSFFTNARGLPDSLRTYLVWFERAGGNSPHIHPWNFYLERLAWFHAPKGPVWSELFILVLAIVGAAVSLAGNLRALGNPRLGRFLTFYTLTLTGFYAIIPYKTPWCLLGFWSGMVLLAGIGAAALVQVCRRRAARVVWITILLAGTAHLAWQGRRAAVDFASDRGNPYVYSQTLPGALKLVERVTAISRSHPQGQGMTVKVISPESYWPLPWYLRQFKNVGWWDTLPDDPYAPVVVTSSRLDARLDEQSNRGHVMTGLFELRPGTYLELYVERGLWEKVVPTLPREPD